MGRRKHSRVQFNYNMSWSHKNNIFSLWLMDQEERGRFVNNLEISISILAPTINVVVLGLSCAPIPSHSRDQTPPIQPPNRHLSLGQCFCVIEDSREQQQCLWSGRSIILNDQTEFHWSIRYRRAAPHHRIKTETGAQVLHSPSPAIRRGWWAQMIDSH